jgi:hypothetical protein
MNIPGFTAEASLYNGNARYQATTEATVYGGIVQPAQGDVFYPDRPVFSIIPFRWGNCLKRVCTRHEYYPGFPVWECQWIHTIC